MPGTIANDPQLPCLPQPEAPKDMTIPVRQCHTIQIRTVIERLGVERGFQSDCPHDVFKPAVSPLALTSLQIRAEVERLGVQEGFVNVLSRHTTTAGAAAGVGRAQLLPRSLYREPHMGAGCRSGMAAAPGCLTLGGSSQQRVGAAQLTLALLPTVWPFVSCVCSDN